MSSYVEIYPLLDGSLPIAVNIGLVPDIPDQTTKCIVCFQIGDESVQERVVAGPVSVVSRKLVGVILVVNAPDIMGKNDELRAELSSLIVAEHGRIEAASILIDAETPSPARGIQLGSASTTILYSDVRVARIRQPIKYLAWLRYTDKWSGIWFGLKF